MQKSYNERLFTGFRGYFHAARFHWLKTSVLKYAPNTTSVIELGCFDAKTIAYLPTLPIEYFGLDANWEGGLILAREKWGHYPKYKFIECYHPDEANVSGKTFDISICMETLEHLDDGLTKEYIKLLSGATKTFLFVTVPNELGIYFLLKYFAKKIIRSPLENYNPRELISHVLGSVESVERKEHKGFDYRKVLREISDSFEIISVKGIPFLALPISWNSTIGIVAYNRRQK